MGENRDKFDIAVDVFGGSAKVLLNIPDEWRKLKVYNDLDRDLYVTFRVLQDPRKSLELSRRLWVAFQHHDAFMMMRHHDFRPDIDTAFKVFYLQTYSFMGDGTTFGRRFKGHKGPHKFHIENFLYVKDRMIENMDFRELMKKYSKPSIFFYLDPLYISSGKKYKHSFKLQDLVDLKKAMDEHRGSYLLNLSFYDDGMEDIFGKPNRTIDYTNPPTENGRKRWICGYWWRFKND